MGHIRAFIAIPLPDQIKAYLVYLQKQLKSANFPKASWPKSNSMHLTLKFLGYVNISDIKTIQNCMEIAVSNILQFSINASSIGVFPSVKKTRVIWAGIKGDYHNLSLLVKEIENQLFKHLNVSREKKRFSPHLTLARLKQPINPEKMTNLIKQYQNDKSDKFIVSKINLFQSELKSSGVNHKRIFSSYLKKN